MRTEYDEKRINDKKLPFPVADVEWTNVHKQHCDSEPRAPRLNRRAYDKRAQLKDEMLDAIQQCLPKHKGRRNRDQRVAQEVMKSVFGEPAYHLRHRKSSQDCQLKMKIYVKLSPDTKTYKAQRRKTSSDPLLADFRRKSRLATR